MKISGSFKEATKELDNFPGLKSILDFNKLEKRILQKYPNGPEVPDGEVTDLYTALLASRFFPQNGHNEATPYGALDNINDCIATVPMSSSEQKKLADKLLNLRTSSLWDTLTELLLARILIKSELPNAQVVIEYPLGTGTKQNTPKDADVAIIDFQGKPILLIDAVTPKASGLDYSQGLDKITDWIEKKYDSKFSAYCSANPNVNVAIVVCLLKNEQFYLAAPMKLIPPHEPVALPVHNLLSKTGLAFAYGSSFRCVDGKNLLVDHLAKYSR